MAENNYSLEIVLSKLESIEKRLDDKMDGLSAADERIEKKLDDYVTRVEFKPVQMIVFGMAGVILTAALVTILQKVGVAKAAAVAQSIIERIF